MGAGRAAGGLGGALSGTTVPFGGTIVPFKGAAGSGAGVNSTRPVVFTTQAYASSLRLVWAVQAVTLELHTQGHHALGNLFVGKWVLEVYVHPQRKIGLDSESQAINELDILSSRAASEIGAELRTCTIRHKDIAIVGSFSTQDHIFAI